MNNKIPYQLFGNQDLQNCLFLHGNGFPPLAYKSFLNNLSKKMSVYAMTQRPFWKTDINPNSIKNWDIFKNDILDFIDQNNLQNSIGVGHSMGGVLILLIEITKPGTFKKIFLLDPVITSIFKSLLYKLLFQVSIIDFIHPMIAATNRKKMIFQTKEMMYQSYRKKEIFSKINDSSLMNYIESIIYEDKKHVKIKISQKWENTIYRSGSMHDIKIWNNLNKINCPSFVILPKEKQFGHFNYGSNLRLKNLRFQNFFINNVSHLFPIERPNKAAEIILSNL